ncbi:NUDIX hydrolase [Parvularcula sp. ZS-1/3]|uniref:GDP-mannose pyrophosphatase n=1 Tax=Parvularcula mediterranea TaxID=2732508 RepID=A0A7Y3W6N0_9PROT|nr:NUDIX hydrolase [Parvularcula mediterranea]NNU17451.1 NUDIX hydrolase [Parvularcula mediterranea]
MTKKHGPWTIDSVRTAYENPWITIRHHEVTRPDGKPGVYGLVNFANRAIGILPLFADGTVPMVGQFRFPLGRDTWEIPEGGGPKAEDPLLSAQRELKEETGCTAGGWHEYGQSDLSNSVTDERAHYFLAWDLTQGEAAPEPDEVFQYKRVTLAELLADIHAGRVDDALTQLCVLTAITKARAGELPDVPSRIILDQVG